MKPKQSALQYDNICRVLIERSDERSDVGRYRVMELNNIRASLQMMMELPEDEDTEIMLDELRQRVHKLIMDSNFCGNHQQFLVSNGDVEPDEAA